MKGIRRDGNRWRVYIRHRGMLREKRFPLDTDLSKMKEWREDTKVAIRRLRPVAGAGTLEADVKRYLEQVRAMPTYTQRAEHLAAWLAELGKQTRRETVTAAEIRTVLHKWRGQYSAATCNKRRTALMHLWSVLDGKGASNPVRDVPRFRVDDALPRGRDPHAIDAALRRAVPSRSRASCRVLLWTGLRPIELARAEPDDLDLKRHTLLVRTAKGGRVRVLPLTSQAVNAWKEFDRIDAWHHVPKAAPLNRWLKKITALDVRVYDLRHAYGTALAVRGTRLDVIGAMMGHSTLELTKRYTLAAVQPDVLTATGKLARKVGRKVGKHKRTRKTRGRAA